MVLIWTSVIDTDKELVIRELDDTVGLTDTDKAGSIAFSSIPAPLQNGLSPILYYQPSTNSLFYEYAEIIPSTEEQLAQLQEAQKTADQKYKELDLTTAALADVKAAKIAQLKYACSQAIYAGFTSSVTAADGTPYEFGYNVLDQGNFDKQAADINLLFNRLQSGKITQADFDANFPIQWKTKNKGVVDLTEDKFYSVTRDAKAFLLNNQTKYWNLEAQVNAATTNAEVDAVVW